MQELEEAWINEADAAVTLDDLDDVETRLHDYSCGTMVERTEIVSGGIEYRIIDLEPLFSFNGIERMRRLARTPVAEFDWGLDEDGEEELCFTTTRLGATMLYVWRCRDH